MGNRFLTSRYRRLLLPLVSVYQQHSGGNDENRMHEVKADMDIQCGQISRCPRGLEELRSDRVADCPSEEGRSICDRPFGLAGDVTGTELKQQGVLALVALQDVEREQEPASARVRGSHGDENDRPDPVEDRKDEHSVDRLMSD